MYVVDGSAYFSRPGPRLVDSLEILAHALAPETHPLPPGLPPVVADRDRIKQVLLNLVLNALQAMPGGGTLTLEAGLSGGGVTLAVMDTGSGIPSEVLPRLFEPYVTTKVKGLGLGLAIARRIVEAHGGRIEAENRPEGGSRFRVTLPLAPAARG